MMHFFIQGLLSAFHQIVLQKYTHLLISYFLSPRGCIVPFLVLTMPEFLAETSTEFRKTAGFAMSEYCLGTRTTRETTYTEKLF